MENVYVIIHRHTFQAAWDDPYYGTIDYDDYYGVVSGTENEVANLVDILNRKNHSYFPVDQDEEADYFFFKKEEIVSAKFAVERWNL